MDLPTGGLSIHPLPEGTSEIGGARVKVLKATSSEALSELIVTKACEVHADQAYVTAFRQYRQPNPLYGEFYCYAAFCRRPD
jgi:hypothetical protein